MTEAQQNGEKNHLFLSVIDAESKADIINSIAKHYGTTATEIWEEVTAQDAENLLDYMTEPHRSGARALMMRHGFCPSRPIYKGVSVHNPAINKTGMVLSVENDIATVMCIDGKVQWNMAGLQIINND